MSKQNKQNYNIMKKGIYYVKELNCICVIYANSQEIMGMRKTIYFSAATFLNDAFTKISHYKCNAEVFKKTFKPIRLTEKNYKMYLSIDNNVGSTAVKNTKNSKSYEFSAKFGLKSIDRKEEVTEIRPRYIYLEEENFKDPKDTKIAIITIEI